MGEGWILIFLLTFKSNNHRWELLALLYLLSWESNLLERQKLPKAFEDFQGHEELKDGLSHCLRQSGALLLQSTTDTLHRYVHIIGNLKDQIICSSTCVNPNNNNNAAWLAQVVYNYYYKDFLMTHLFLQLPVWNAEEIYFHRTARTKNKWNQYNKTNT